MFGFCSSDSQQKSNCLPSPLPQWPQGQGTFATGIINLGELEVAMVKDFKLVYTYTMQNGSCGVSFYKAVSIPEGFFSLGDYSQPSHQPADGYLLVARNTSQRATKIDPPPLKAPLRYDLIWSSDQFIYLWQPVPPVGYRVMGFVVTNKHVFPALEQVWCVREDLTEKCGSVIDRNMLLSRTNILVFSPKAFAGTFSKGVTVGTSYATSLPDVNCKWNVCCLKNMNPNLEAMPNLEQVEALLDHYGPTVYFHPDEVYFPSSVSWFFKSGGLVSKNGGEFWLDLPLNDDTHLVKHGNLKSAQLYARVKPVLGGTFTDIDMSIFYPFKGPDTFTIAYLFNLNMEGNKHVGGWEHFTLRVSNFDGQLWSVYFSQNTCGKWFNASNLEFIEGNKPIVYSSKWGHGTFPSAGKYIQGSRKLLGTGVKNVVDKSDMFIDGSKRYQIVAAEYLGGVVAPPEWLQYMREWGPTVLNNEQISSHLPSFIRPSLRWLIDEALRPEKAAWFQG